VYFLINYTLYTMDSHIWTYIYYALHFKGAIMYDFFRTLHDMFRRVHNMYPHTIIYFVSEMTNSKLVPKKLKFSKKNKIFQKSQNLTNLAFLEILAFFAFFAFFGFFAFLANFGFFGQFWLFFGFFGKFWISCSLHRGYI
jgi:hypothetical protein